MTRAIPCLHAFLSFNKILLGAFAILCLHSCSIFHNSINGIPLIKAKSSINMPASYIKQHGDNPVNKKQLQTISIEKQNISNGIHLSQIITQRSSKLQTTQKLKPHTVYTEKKSHKIIKLLANISLVRERLILNSKKLNTSNIWGEVLTGIMGVILGCAIALGFIFVYELFNSWFVFSCVMFVWCLIWGVICYFTNNNTDNPPSDNKRRYTWNMISIWILLLTGLGLAYLWKIESPS